MEKKEREDRGGMMHEMRKLLVTRKMMIIMCITRLIYQTDLSRQNDVETN